MLPASFYYSIGPMLAHAQTAHVLLKIPVDNILFLLLAIVSVFGCICCYFVTLYMVLVIPVVAIVVIAISQNVVVILIVVAIACL